MSHITIKIDTDNAAFDPESFEIEVARILRDLAVRAESGSYGEYIPIRDINGNTVGSFNHYTD